MQGKDDTSAECVGVGGGGGGAEVQSLQIGEVAQLSRDGARQLVVTEVQKP